MRKKTLGKTDKQKQTGGGKTNPAKVYNDERERHESLLQGWGGEKEIKREVVLRDRVILA